MKFAAIALIASASAIKLQVETQGCVSPADAKEGFEYVDSNHNGSIDKKELVTALNAFAKSQHYTPTKADWAWVKKHAVADAAMGGNKHTMDLKEFTLFANQFATHFGLCK